MPGPIVQTEKTDVDCHWTLADVIAIFFCEAVNHPNFSNTNVPCFTGFSVEPLPLKHLLCPILDG